MNTSIKAGEMPASQDAVISLRAYAQPPVKPWFANPIGKAGGAAAQTPRPRPTPSEWVLVFDTETTTDAGQGFRFGSYQARRDGALYEAGLFYELDALTAAELTVLEAHAGANDLRLITRAAFVEEVFYGIGYDLRATIVGLNLPFDLSRIAIADSSARGSMRGGFSLKLTADKRRPAVQVKHLSQRTSLIRFAAPFRQRKARSERKRQDYVPVPRGFFVDVGTLGSALFTRSFTLAGLGEFLNIEHPKLDLDDFDSPITEETAAYAVRDALATWECYEALMVRYAGFGLSETPAHLIYSEASLGKAYLRAMGVKPWREVQPDVPPKLLATIMGAYFGGRSEVRIRRERRQVVLCDFLSMYPTVCTLMGLWTFMRAKGMTWRHDPAWVRELLGGITLVDLQRPEVWRHLTVLVEVMPSGDIFPVRAPYEPKGQATIGLNGLRSERGLWFTLADCIASKLLTGRSPEVIDAIVFEAGPVQDGLPSVDISGNATYRVDPAEEDFFKRLIELRQMVKGARDALPDGEEKDHLDAEQNALKIAANATSYGVFVEINVNERAKRGEVVVHTALGEPYIVETENDEEPGRFFHPLLAALITGAARLMLAITERLILDEGLEWSFCDTDSMAIARPIDMSEAEFHARVGAVVGWFAHLNPYDFGGSILKVEEVNDAITAPHVPVPLQCWAISAKRYVLFNVGDDGQPVLRKASAHGLGHIRAPYDKKNPSAFIPPPSVKLSKLGVELWQHDLWWRIAQAALSDRPDEVDLDFHPALAQPAVSRYAATTPKLLAWFKAYNLNLPYARKVKPFGFLLALFADRSYAPDSGGVAVGDMPPRRRKRPRLPRPVAPFDKDHAKAILKAFDRETPQPVPAAALRTVRGVISEYTVHSESKFWNGKGIATGTTRRRHIRVTGIRHIGKEANRWEEQRFVGLDEEPTPDYGLLPADTAERATALAEARQHHGVRALAREARVPVKAAAAAISDPPNSSEAVVDGLLSAARKLSEHGEKTCARREGVLGWARTRAAAEGHNVFARRVELDPKNLRKMLLGHRTIGARTLTKLEAFAAQGQEDANAGL
jgi:hypothetical protein